LGEWRDRGIAGTPIYFQRRSVPFRHTDDYAEILLISMNAKEDINLDLELNGLSALIDWNESNGTNELNELNEQTKRTEENEWSELSLWIVSIVNLWNQ